MGSNKLVTFDDCGMDNKIKQNPLSWYMQV